MRKLICSIVLTLILVPTGAAVQANLRAPYEVAGHHSSSINGDGVGITLDREDISVVLPVMDLNEMKLPPAKVKVAYTFTTLEEKAIPVLFIGMFIEKISIHVNGKKVETAFVSAADELKTYMSKHTEHCAQYRHCLKVNFNDKNFNYLEDDTSDRNRNDKDIVGMVRFSAPMKTGKNTWVIEYDQGINFTEGGVSYFKDHYPEDSRFTFDYALYPSHTIPRAANFVLDIKVVVPDGIKKTLMFTMHEPAAVNTNLDLVKIHSEEKYTQVYHGRFRTFPTDFLTIAFRYPG